METLDQTSIEKSAKLVSQDYVEFLNLMPDLFKDEELSVEESIDSVMMRLDEFYGMLDMIRADSSQITEELLQSFRTERDRLKIVYERINKLETLVETIRNNCLAVEKSVDGAAAVFGSINPVKKVLGFFHLTSFENAKSTLTPTKPKMPYAPPEIFSTSNYIPHSSSDTSKNLQDRWVYFAAEN